MLFSTSTYLIADREDVGLRRCVELLCDAGFPAIDFCFQKNDYAFRPDYISIANETRDYVESRGVVFNQAHAPCGGGYEKYTTEIVPTLPRVFEFAGLLGVKNVVVHPLQRGRYYGQEDELFELNMEFYTKLAPYAKNAGVKICIENMWHFHPVTKVIVDDTCADPKELVKYYDTLNDPEAFTICLDLGHVALCGREPEVEIKTVGHERLGAIRAHDVDYVNDLHTLPGTAKLNYDAICRSLAEIDYKGDFTLESTRFPHNYPTEFLPTVLKFMADTAKFYADKVEVYKKALKK